MSTNQQKPEGNVNLSRNTPHDLVALKSEIISKIDIKTFYKDMLGENLTFKSDGWSSLCFCPFHPDESNPNLSVNCNSGGFRCFRCGVSGSIFDFYSLRQGMQPASGFQDSLLALCQLAGININDKREVPAVPTDATSTPIPSHYGPRKNKAENIDNQQPPLDKGRAIKAIAGLGPDNYEYLRFNRGIVDSTIKKYKIGFDGSIRYKNREGEWTKGRYTIPIFNKSGELRNIRLYAADALKEYKMLNTKGYGTPPRLYPLNELISKKPDIIIYCEGEFDTILLNQELEKIGVLGRYLAITNTHGCKTFESEWMTFFEGCGFVFLLDVDEAGKSAASSHATQYIFPSVSSGKMKFVKIAHLPLSGSKDSKDIGDYLVRQGGTIEELLLIITNTPELQSGGVNNKDAVVPYIEISDFVEAVKDRRYIDQRVRVPITIGGQTNKIYHAPRSIKVSSCPMMREGKDCCASGVQIIPYGENIFIECCMASKKQVAIALQDVACTKKQPCTIEEIEKVVMEEHYAHQQVKRLTAVEDEKGRFVNSQELVNVKTYILQPENNNQISPQDYIATGYVRSHPVTREVCLFVETLEPLEEDWKKFELNEEHIQNLKTIKSFDNVKMILDELTEGVTQIYESNDILLTILLTYLSPLWIPFNGNMLRGWINSCIIGDSGTGKTKTYERISNWLDIGDLFSTLSGSRTGLLYAIKQKGTEWYVQIGRYVVASGKILAVDETQEMEAEEIKKMAKAMDEGWLEVSRVASGGYKTQTRTLLLMNPKNGKKISDYAYGCQAIQECFHPMFIRRLDIAVFSTGKDNPEFYNKPFDIEKTKSMKLTSRAFRSLVYWAWTRMANDIHWDSEATSECLAKAIEMSNVYGNADDIPLVNPQDFRNNLARLSTAFAILSGSFTEDMKGVLVTAKHVQFMSKFVDVLYSSSSCNLKQHSRNSAKKKTLNGFEIIKETIENTIENAKHSSDLHRKEGCHFLQMLIILQDQQKIRLRDMVDQVGVNMRWAKKHISILSTYNLVEVYSGNYKATRKFNLFMQKWMEDPVVDEMVQSVNEKVGKYYMTQGDDGLNGFNGNSRNVRYGTEEESEFQDYHFQDEA